MAVTTVISTTKIGWMSLDRLLAPFGRTSQMIRGVA